MWSHVDQNTNHDSTHRINLVVPAQVSVTMKEGITALAVGAGLQVMAALKDADVTELTELTELTGMIL